MYSQRQFFSQSLLARGSCPALSLPELNHPACGGVTSIPTQIASYYKNYFHSSRKHKELLMMLLVKVGASVKQKIEEMQTYRLEIQPLNVLSATYVTQSSANAPHTGSQGCELTYFILKHHLRMSGII